VRFTKQKSPGWWSTGLDMVITRYSYRRTC